GHRPCVTELLLKGYDNVPDLVITFFHQLKRGIGYIQRSFLIVPTVVLVNPNDHIGASPYIYIFAQCVLASKKILLDQPSNDRIFRFILNILLGEESAFYQNSF